MDDKLQNVSLTTQNKLGSLHNLSNIFTQEGVNMAFIKSHFANAWTHNKKFCLDLSIDKQTSEKLDSLSKKFNEMGVQFKK